MGQQGNSASTSGPSHVIEQAGQAPAMPLSKQVRPSHVIEQAGQAPAMSLSKLVRPSLAIEQAGKAKPCH